MRFGVFFYRNLAMEPFPEQVSLRNGSTGLLRVLLAPFFLALCRLFCHYFSFFDISTQKNDVKAPLMSYLPNAIGGLLFLLF